MEKQRKQGTMEEYMKLFDLGQNQETKNNFRDLNRELHDRFKNDEPIQVRSLFL